MVKPGKKCWGITSNKASDISHPY